MPPVDVQETCVETDRGPVQRGDLMLMFESLIAVASVFAEEHAVTGATIRALVHRAKDALAREPKATVPGADAAFHLYRLGDVRLCDHSSGVALIDVQGNATVLDAALVSALYDVCTRDRRPPVVEARELQAGEFHASADVEAKP